MIEQGWLKKAVRPGGNTNHLVAISSEYSFSTYSKFSTISTVLLRVLFEKSGECTVRFYYSYVIPINRTVLKNSRMYCLILLLLCMYHN